MTRKFNVDKMSLAVFQNYKIKHDFILIQGLMKNLLSEECGYYSSRNAVCTNILSSLMSELRDNEFNLDLTTEFYSLLRRRSYLLPRSGITLKPKNIDFSIDLYERQYDGDNYIIAVTNLEDGSYFTFINLTRGFTVNNSPWLYDLCNFLYSFYKLETEALQLYGESYYNDPYLLLNFKFDDYLTSGVGL